MLLAVDVGNTNITFGVFEGSEMVTRFHFSVRISRTSDEYGSMICDILERKGFSADSIDQVIVASVVPKIMYSFNSGIIKYLGCHPIIVGAGIRTGIRIETANPKEVGPDRIVDAVAAHTLYGGPIIVADYGTATTYDLVTKDGCENFCQCPLERYGKSAGNRDQVSGACGSKGYDHSDAGWSFPWNRGTVPVYYQ